MLKVRQIKVEARKNNYEEILIKKLNIKKEDIISYKIKKQSIDARKKDEIFYVYEIDVNLKNEDKIKLNNDIEKTKEIVFEFKKDKEIVLDKRPVIVGMGPSGLFAAYIFALNGLKPIIIDRGKCVEDRIQKVEEFWKNNKLDLDTNVQFGEGGAGTFSDGKLNTQVKDKENLKEEILKTFVKYGADEEILYSYKPHVGTDVLVGVIKNIRDEIKTLGGEFFYDSKLNDIKIEGSSLKQIKVNEKWIDTDILVLALGHSSRDTFRMLYNRNLNIESKPFAIGVRIQHNQDMIDESLIGNKYKDIISKMSYKLTYTSSYKRGVYTFCMCPGGYVVNASSENERLCINGMSYKDRDSKIANSAIVVTVTKRDFGESPLGGIEYQEQLENKVYKIGNGLIPTQLLKDFMEDRVTTCFKTVIPKFKGNYILTNLNGILDKEITESIKEALIDYGKKIKGFDSDDAIISLIESRTSSPIRIVRDENYKSNINGIYPIGEGAGYAGGIISASMDGVKAALSIIDNI